MEGRHEEGADSKERRRKDCAWVGSMDFLPFFQVNHEVAGGMPCCGCFDLMLAGLKGY